jgi:recombination protein RecA
MPSAARIRAEIEQSLAHRIPSALTPVRHVFLPRESVGIEAVDAWMAGGLPLGAVTEIVGPECSGRTSFALSFLARLTRAGKVCAWVDVMDTLHPESAAAAGVDLSRLLWIRCGAAPEAAGRPSAGRVEIPEKYLMAHPAKKGLHGGGMGLHPREEARGLSRAVEDFLGAEKMPPRRAEPSARYGQEAKLFDGRSAPVFPSGGTAGPRSNAWMRSQLGSRLEQGLKAADLLLHAGGFGAVVLDMGSLAAEEALRVPASTWFRCRAVARENRTAVLLLTQCACAKSSAALVLEFEQGGAAQEDTTVFTGVEYRIRMAQDRLQPESGENASRRKPPRSEGAASWRASAAWAGRR